MTDVPDASGSDELAEAPPEPDPVEDLSLQAPQDDHSREDWEAATAAMLRKAGRLAEGEPETSVWQKLAHTTLDGFSVSPLGTEESLTDVATSGRPGRTGAWDIRAQHRGAADIVNTEALADLQGGVSSLWLTVDEELPAERIGEALHEVHLDLAPVILDATVGSPIEAAEAFLGALGDRIPAPGTNLGIDPLAGAITSGDAEAAGDVSALVSQAAELAQRAGTLALVVDGTALHDLGASDGQELGWSIAVGISYLRALEAAGISVDDAAALIEFRYAVTDEQFPSIAKLRAGRRLWARVTQASGGAPAEQRQHAVTSRPMMGKYDPYVNVLRTTVAAFAAGVGGADAVTVVPFDSPHGRSAVLGRRIARNISHLLIEESHLAIVADPAGGSFAVERLTDDLAQAAWAELGRIESAGGAMAAISGVRERVAAVAEQREREVATRRRPLTGISEFPHLGEELPERTGEGDQTRRYGAAFEALRDAPATGPVFLATMGPVAAHTARASFVSNLLAAGGVGVEVAGASEGVDEVVAAFHAAGDPSVVCLAGTDAAYKEWGDDLISALRAAGASHLILAGKPGERSGVEPDAVDDAAAMGVDAIAFLTRTRKALA